MLTLVVLKAGPDSAFAALFASITIFMHDSNGNSGVWGWAPGLLVRDAA